MKDYKFKSSPKLDSIIKTILANSRFSSFQEYVEWRINGDHSRSTKNHKLE
jgi:hypothetical protein